MEPNSTDTPTISLVTATYNRANLLPRTYASIRTQTYLLRGPIEWIIVDDGSTDGTRTLMKQLDDDPLVRMRYIWQKNQGKHSALNAGIELAAGYMIGLLDSDDELLPTALEALIEAWLEIPVLSRLSFVGVTATCVDGGGKTIGTPLKSSPLDVTYQEAHIVHRMQGERWGIQRRDVLAQFPFPGSPDERSTPESLIWRAIGERFRTRYISEPVRVYHTDHAQRLSTEGFAQRAHGAFLGARAVLQTDLTVSLLRKNPKYFLRIAATAVRSGLHDDKSIEGIARDLSPLGKAVVLGAFPIGWWYYSRDRKGVVG